MEISKYKQELRESDKVIIRDNKIIYKKYNKEIILTGYENWEQSNENYDNVHKFYIRNLIDIESYIQNNISNKLYIENSNNNRKAIPIKINSTTSATNDNT